MEEETPGQTFLLKADHKLREKCYPRIARITRIVGVRNTVHQLQQKRA